MKKLIIQAFFAVIMTSWYAAPYRSHAMLREFNDSIIIECKNSQCGSCFHAGCTIENNVCLLRDSKTWQHSPVQNCTKAFVDPAIVPSFEAQRLEDGLYFIETDFYAWWEDRGDEEGLLSWQVYDVSQ